MLNARTIIVLAAVAASVSVQVLAQQSAPGAGSGLVATTNNPNLTVATVKLEGGTRASKVIGTALYVGEEKVGTVDDLVITGDNKVSVAVISVGGVLGVGGRLVAVPFDQIKLEGDKVTLPGVTKDALAAMPAFTY